MENIKIWERNQALISGQEYIGNQLIAKNASMKGYKAIIDKYVYIDSDNVGKTFDLIPKTKDLIQGIGIDLGGGVGCISSTLAKRENVEKIYCIEIVEDVVRYVNQLLKNRFLETKQIK